MCLVHIGLLGMQCRAAQHVTDALLQDATKKRGYRLVGDVDFDAVSQKAAAITPVPGGVGPMTIAMLLQNCLEGFKAQNDL